MENFNRHAGRDLKQHIAERMVQDVDVLQPQDVLVDIQGGSGVNIHVRYHERQIVEPDIRAHLEIDFMGRGAYWSEIRLADHFQNRGIGPGLFENGIALARDIAGITLCGLKPGLSMGGYSWARNGALPANEGECRNLAKYMAEREGHLKAVLPPDVYYPLRDATQMRRPEDLWKVADTDYDLSGGLDTLRSSFDFWSKLTMKSQIMAHTLMGRPTPGRFLLAGANYEAVFNSANPAQMERLKKTRARGRARAQQQVPIPA